MTMHHAIRKTAALFAVLGAIGIAQAEGGPGDNGAANPDSAASAAGHSRTSAKKNGHKGMAGKSSARSASGANGAKADGPMGNASVGKGG
jgi:hypothetical protein